MEWMDRLIPRVWAYSMEHIELLIAICVISLIMLAAHYFTKRRLRREMEAKYRLYFEVHEKGNGKMEKFDKVERLLLEQRLIADGIQNHLDDLFLDGKLSGERRLYWMRRFADSLRIKDLNTRSYKILKELIRERLAMKAIVYKPVRFPDESTIKTENEPVPGDKLEKPKTTSVLLKFAPAKRVA